MQEGKDYEKCEDAVENFLADDSSSDENIDCNMIKGGTCHLYYFFTSYGYSLLRKNIFVLSPFLYSQMLNQNKLWDPSTAD